MGLLPISLTNKSMGWGGGDCGVKFPEKNIIIMVT